jgi:hypothetical protein
MRPSQSENRREAIIVGTCYRDDAGEIQVALAAREILRGPDGWPTGH